MPDPSKTAISLTAEEVGVLAAISCGSPEISVRMADDSRKQNEPDKNYSRIITNCYLSDGGTDKVVRNMKAFNMNAHKQVREALESGNMEKLGRLLADGLKQNNKWLQGQKDLSDYYAVYAELGGKLLDIVKKNEQLKQTFEKYLGQDLKQQRNIAKAARNINDLRAKAMPLKEKLMKDFAQYEVSGIKGVKGKPVHVSSNQEISTICQLCMIQHGMKDGDFNLATTEYKNSNMVNKNNDFMNDNEILDNFRLKRTDRETVLDDVVEMSNLYTRAINLKSSQLENQKNALNIKNAPDKQNEPNKEQNAKTGPMT
jgi:hypothetical protein